MREIKFKVWDIKYKEMLVGHQMTANGNGEFNNNPQRVPLQYTGIKDKKGNEIYEGDIVRVGKNNNYEIIWVTELEYQEKCSGWGMKPLNIPMIPFLYDDWAIKNGIIIGNIYQNPELLK